MLILPKKKKKKKKENLESTRILRSFYIHDQLITVDTYYIIMEEICQSQFCEAWDSDHEVIYYSRFKVSIQAFLKRLEDGLDTYSDWRRSSRESGRGGAVVL